VKEPFKVPVEQRCNATNEIIYIFDRLGPKARRDEKERGRIELEDMKKVRQQNASHVVVAC